MYHVPNRPLYGGAYQWRTVLTGLAAILLLYCLSSAMIANYYHYHPALGQPIFKLGTLRLYQPFSWIVWLYRYGSSRNAMLFFYSGLAFFGSLLIALAASISNAHRHEHLVDNTDQLHGSARWAERHDIEKTGLLTTTAGVYVGGWYDKATNYLHYLRHNGPEHVLLIAPPRSGKGVGLVIPTLLAWDESAIIYDIKGENWAKTSGYRASQGHLCFKFSPVEQHTSSRFNPLSELRLHTPRDVSDAQNIAELIALGGGESAQDRYWEEAAASIMTGMILHVCYAAAATNRTASLSDLADAFTDPDAPSFRQHLGTLLNYEHDPGGAHHWRTKLGRQTRTHQTVRKKIKEMLTKADKDMSGVLSTCNARLSIFADPLVAANTAASDFRVSDLVDHEKPISVYIVVPPSDEERLRPLVRILCTVIVTRLMERLDFEGSQLVTRNHRLLFMIDEFPSLKRMTLFANALPYMGGYGLKAYLIAQAKSQIEAEYGANQSITSLCDIKIAYAPNDLASAELLSKMAGTRTIERATVTYSGKRVSPALDNVSTGIDVMHRPLLAPEEVLRIKRAEKTGDGSAERISAPGDMLIFLPGHFPIYGRMMLYPFDPVLRARADIPPPIDMIRILPDGTIAPQLPPHRTENVLSPPEVIPQAPAGDAAYQAWLAAESNLVVKVPKTKTATQTEEQGDLPLGDADDDANIWFD